MVASSKKEYSFVDVDDDIGVAAGFFFTLLSFVALVESATSMLPLLLLLPGSDVMYNIDDDDDDAKLSIFD
jgi:hypothetical protein